jgi:hypothetical protein
MKNFLTTSLTIAALLAAPFAAAQSVPAGNASAGNEQPAPRPFTAAIFVRNLAGADLAEREQAFEDRVAARLGSGGLRVLSRAEVTARLSAAAAPAGVPGTVPAAPIVITGTTPKSAFPAAAALEDNTSALRLAQNIGAEFILSVSLLSLEKDVRHFEGFGVATENVDYTIRVAWKLLEAGHGGAIIGGEESATRRYRSAGWTHERTSNVATKLLSDVSERVANAVRERLNTERETVRAAQAAAAIAGVSFTVRVSAENIFFPELNVAPDKTLRITNPKGAVAVDSVTVELDGVVIGSAAGSGATFRVKPGLHQLRLSREGFKPWLGTVNISDGFVYNATLELTEDGLKRWREQAAFTEQLINGRKLTDAQVKLIEGKAQEFRQSGYLVSIKQDIKSDIKQDTKSDIKQDTKTEVKQDAKSDVKTDD